MISWMTNPLPPKPRISALFATFCQKTKVALLNIISKHTEIKPHPYLSVTTASFATKRTKMSGSIRKKYIGKSSLPTNVKHATNK